MKILYICTHNRCRSILSEALTNHLAGDVITARSAGSQPVGAVHPLSIHYLVEKGVDTNNLQSQSWQDFEHFDPDLVITVCSSAANETCPVWFGNTVHAHWELTDPSKLEGSEEEIATAFRECIANIIVRVEHLKTLAEQSPSRDKIAGTMHQLGALVKS